MLNKEEFEKARAKGIDSKSKTGEALITVFFLVYMIAFPVLAGFLLSRWKTLLYTRPGDIVYDPVVGFWGLFTPLLFVGIATAAWATEALARLHKGFYPDHELRQLQSSGTPDIAKASYQDYLNSKRVFNTVMSILLIPGLILTTLLFDSGFRVTPEGIVRNPILALRSETLPWKNLQKAEFRIKKTVVSKGKSGSLTTALPYLTLHFPGRTLAIIRQEDTDQTSLDRIRKIMDALVLYAGCGIELIEPTAEELSLLDALAPWRAEDIRGLIAYARRRAAP